MVMCRILLTLSLANVPVGELPRDWLAAKTGEGPGSVWKVVEDATAPGGKALAQTSAEGPKRLFNLCVNDKVKFRDLDVSVAFKAVAGKIDQGGGLVWRYKDHNNYYLARMNPLENNYRVYKVVGGKRTQLATVDLKAAAGWHTLARCPPGQSHPVPIRRQTVSRRKRRHVPEGRQDRPLDQGRRTNAFRRSAGRGLSAWGDRGPKP